MAILSQSGADLGQGQIILPGNQSMNAFSLRLDPVRQTIPATRSVAALPVVAARAHQRTALAGLTPNRSTT
jgi:hypothetical protein